MYNLDKLSESNVDHRVFDQYSYHQQLLASSEPFSTNTKQNRTLSHEHAPINSNAITPITFCVSTLSKLAAFIAVLSIILLRELQFYPHHWHPDTHFQHHLFGFTAVDLLSICNNLQSLTVHARTNVLTSASQMVFKFIELHYVGWNNSSHPSWIA